MPEAHVVTPSLTEDQLKAYLDYIKLPATWRSADCPRDASLLHALHVHQITAIPYENLGLHYVADREPRISTDLSHILAKALHHGRGGYCMEGNLLFNAVLRALGFDAYLTGARIRIRTNNVPAGPWTGLQHVVNIVTIHNPDKGCLVGGPRRIMSDVAFGGDGPVAPLPLLHNDRDAGDTNQGDEIITQNLGTQQVRVAWQQLDGALSHQYWWVYQYRNRATDDWNSYYTFQDNEFLWCDFEVMNWYPSADSKHFHRVIPVVVKFVDDGYEPTAEADATSTKVKRIIGKIMLADRVIKQNMGGRTEILVTCASEQERIDGLHRYLNMTFTPDEQAGIRNRVSEIVQ